MSDEEKPKRREIVSDEEDLLLQQAQRLPGFAKNTDGDPSQHVKKVTDGDAASGESAGSENEGEFGYEPLDPSQFTGD